MTGSDWSLNAPARKLEPAAPEIGYPLGLRQPSTSAVFRIVTLAIIAVLLQTMFLSVNCLAMSTGKSSTSVEDSRRSECPGGADGDGGCCSFCFCCHFAGVLNATGLSLSLDTNGLLEPDWNPFPRQSFISSFDRPPRA